MQKEIVLFMAYSITLSERSEYIILKITGETNRRSTGEVVAEAHALGKETGIHRYLMDLREARNTDRIFDQYEFVREDLPRIEDFNRAAVVAALVAPNDHSHDFVETATRNAGLLIKLFTDLDTAIAYLY